MKSQQQFNNNSPIVSYLAQPLLDILNGLPCGDRPFLSI